MHNIIIYHVLGRVLKVSNEGSYKGGLNKRFIIMVLIGVLIIKKSKFLVAA